MSESKLPFFITRNNHVTNTILFFCNICLSRQKTDLPSPWDSLASFINDLVAASGWYVWVGARAAVPGTGTQESALWVWGNEV